MEKKGGKKKKKRCRKWSFASLPTCQVKPSPTKWTLSSPDMMGDFAHTCQSVSGTHLPTCPSTAPRGAILLFTHAGWWEKGGVGRGGAALRPDSPPPKIDPESRVLLGSSESSLSWHIVRKLRKVAICPGICHPNLKYKRDMIPLNLDQIPLSLQTSVTHCRRVWTNASRTRDVGALQSLAATRL